MTNKHWFIGLGVFVVGVIIAMAIYNRLPSFAALTVSTKPAGT